jgi:hypothetical protein
MRLFLLILALGFNGCAPPHVSGEIHISNPQHAALQCTSTIDGKTQMFSLSTDYWAFSEHEGAISISCQKQTPGDLNAVTAQFILNGATAQAASTSDEYGVTTVSGRLQ